MYSDFKELRLKAGFTRIKDLANYLGKSCKTIRNWEKNGAPKMAIRAIQYQAGIAKGWKSFQFSDNGYVRTPIEDTFSSTEIEQIKYFNKLCYSLGAQHLRMIKALEPEITNINTYKNAKEEFKKRRTANK